MNDCEILYEIQMNNAIFAIMKWKKNRENLIQKLKFIIDKLNAVQRNVDITKIAGNSTAIVGATMAVVGAILTPFTFGASLGLTIAGGSLTAAGSLTSVGSHLANFFISKSELELAQLLLDEDKRLLLEIQDILRDDHFRINLIRSAGTTLGVMIGAIQLTCLADDIAFLSSNLVVRTATNISVMISSLTIVFSIFGALFNIADIVGTSQRMSQGSRSEYARELEKIVKQMEDDLRL